MGSSARGIVAYGYDLGGEDGWKIAEVGEYGSLSVTWYDDDAVDEDNYDEDFIEQAKKRLLSAAGVESLADLGIEFEFYGVADDAGCILAAKVIKGRAGNTKPLDTTALQCEPVENHWDDKLAAALAVLDITPKQGRPGWLLCAYYG